MAAADPSLGFSIQGRVGSPITVELSRFLHPGTMVVGGDNSPTHLGGIMTNGSSTRIWRSTFLHGLWAITSSRSRTVIEENTFKNNAVDIHMMDGEIAVRGNRSLAPGIFTQIEEKVRKVRIVKNQVDWCLAGCIPLPGGDLPVSIIDNTITRSVSAISMGTSRGVTLSGNTLMSCFSDLVKDLGRPEVLRDNTLSNNTIKSREGCPW